MEPPKKKHRGDDLGSSRSQETPKRRLDELPDELLLKIESNLERDDLLHASLVCRSLGRTSQEMLMRSVELATRSTVPGNRYSRPRYLFRTLLHRPDLLSKVKNLSLVLASPLDTGAWLQAHTISSHHRDPLSPQEVSSMASIILRQNSRPFTGLIPYEVGFPSHTDVTSAGALLGLLAHLETLHLKIVAERPHTPVFQDLVGVAAAARLERVAAFATIHTLKIEQLNGPGHLVDARPLFRLSNLTTLVLSGLDARGGDGGQSAVKHLVLEQWNAEEPPARILQSIGPLVSFTFKEDTEDHLSDLGDFGHLIHMLEDSYPTLEELTILCSSRDHVDSAFPVTPLRCFERLRFLEIDQLALLGVPVIFNMMYYDHPPQEGDDLGEGEGSFELLPVLPMSLETLVIRCANAGIWPILKNLAEIREVVLGFDGEDLQDEGDVEEYGFDLVNLRRIVVDPMPMYSTEAYTVPLLFKKVGWELEVVGQVALEEGDMFLDEEGRPLDDEELPWDEDMSHLVLSSTRRFGSWVPKFIKNG